MTSFTYWGWMTETKSRKIFSIICGIVYFASIAWAWSSNGTTGALFALIVGLLIWQSLIVAPRVLVMFVVMLGLIQAAVITGELVHYELIPWFFWLMVEAAVAWVANSLIGDILTILMRR